MLNPYGRAVPGQSLTGGTSTMQPTQPYQLENLFRQIYGMPSSGNQPQVQNNPLQQILAQQTSGSVSPSTLAYILAKGGMR